MTTVLWLKNCWKIEIFLDERIISKARYEGDSLDYEVIVSIHSSESLLEKIEKLLAEHASLRHLIKVLLSFELFGLLWLSKSAQDKHQSFFESQQIRIFWREVSDGPWHLIKRNIENLDNLLIWIEVLNQLHFFYLCWRQTFSSNISHDLLYKLLLILWLILVFDSGFALREGRSVFKLTRIERLVDCSIFMDLGLLFCFLLVGKICLKIWHEVALLFFVKIDFIHFTFFLVLLGLPCICLFLLLFYFTLFPDIRSLFIPINSLSFPYVPFIFIIFPHPLFFLYLASLSLMYLCCLLLQLSAKIELLFFWCSKSFKMVILHILIINLAGAILVLKVRHRQFIIPLTGNH